MSFMSVLGLAAEKALTLGDSAPAFPVDGYAKGKEIKSFSKGSVYVVEFWATWCGPCISSMPHLSDLADKFRGKAEFISVNTWDYAGKGNKKESVAEHKARVKEWMSKNEKNMRYNVAFDDEKDTISTTWMRAAGQNGIPCAMIVNRESKIAWIGHPMEMDQPLKEIVDGNYDLAKNKEQFVKEQEAERARANFLNSIAARSAKGYVFSVIDDIDGAKGSDKGYYLQVALGQLSASNSSAAAWMYKKYVGQIKEMQPFQWCGLARPLVAKLKGDERAEIISISEQCANMTPKGMSAIAYIYHAGVLYSAGDKASAKAWAEKAKTAVADYPEQGRESVTKFIDNQVASFK